MNERIIELADKAVEDISSGPWNISDEFCKKFAELIIKECSVALSPMLRDMISRGQAVDLIQKHFGVEL